LVSDIPAGDGKLVNLFYGVLVNDAQISSQNFRLPPPLALVGSGHVKGKLSAHVQKVPVYYYKPSADIHLVTKSLSTRTIEGMNSAPCPTLIP